LQLVVVNIPFLPRRQLFSVAISPKSNPILK
jgi:hypothetical protein